MEKYAYEFEEITPDKIDASEMELIDKRSGGSKIEKVWEYRARKFANKLETGFFAHVTKDNKKYTIYKSWTGSKVHYSWYSVREGWLDAKTYLSVEYNQHIRLTKE